jgi:mannose-6-phosphate isomerase
LKLTPRLVEKPWGRNELPPVFGSTNGRRIGELWFEGPGELPLLAKYLFTNEPLSIQNHPAGKEECWLIVDAEPGAALGLGLRNEVSREELREAALDGSVVDLVDWKRVQPGDFYYMPPGTVHAVGAGIVLVEFQQNCDVTYRLHDYGRPRALNVDDAVAAALRGPYAGRSGRIDAARSSILAEGPPFALVHAVNDGSFFGDRPRWVLPLDGRVRAGRDEAAAGECLLVQAREEVAIDGRALIGAEGAA